MDRRSTSKISPNLGHTKGEGGGQYGKWSHFPLLFLTLPLPSQDILSKIQITQLQSQDNMSEMQTTKLQLQDILS